MFVAFVVGFSMALRQKNTLQHHSGSVLRRLRINSIALPWICSVALVEDSQHADGKRLPFPFDWRCSSWFRFHISKSKYPKTPLLFAFTCRHILALIPETSIGGIFGRLKLPPVRALDPQWGSPTTCSAIVATVYLLNWPWTIKSSCHDVLFFDFSSFSTSFTP